MVRSFEREPGRVSQLAPDLYVEWTVGVRHTPRLLWVLPAREVPHLLTPLTPTERLQLDEQLTARQPRRARWHLSVVPARHPTVVAWYGRPQDPNPEPLARVWDAEGRPAVWMSGSVAGAVQVAQQALLARGIPAHVSPLPPALARTLAWLAPPSGACTDGVSESS